MKYMKRILLFALCAAGSALSGSNTTELPSQARARAQMARFWQVAESRVAEAETTPVRASAVEASPVRPLNPVNPSYYRPAPLPPPPTVTMVQSVDRNQDSGHFGLQLFGGLRLFDFTWGDESVREKDAIEGRL